jgi:hypothetical protein
LSHRICHVCLWLVTNRLFTVSARFYQFWFDFGTEGLCASRICHVCLWTVTSRILDVPA